MKLRRIAARVRSPTHRTLLPLSVERRMFLNKKGFVIRFYRQFDADLIYLIERMISERIDVSVFVKTVVRCHLTNKECKLASLVREVMARNVDKPAELRKKLQYHLELKETEDKDIIDFIYSMKRGYRSIVLKTILRQGAGDSIVLACHKDTPIEFIGVE